MAKNIIHVEFTVDDVERAQKFYSEVLGWNFKKVPMEGMDYHFIDMDGDEQVTGGMMARTEQYSQDQAVNYFNVENIEASMAQVSESGGKVLGKKMPVKGYGWAAHCHDTEGNLFALWQEDTNAA